MERSNKAANFSFGKRLAEEVEATFDRLLSVNLKGLRVGISPTELVHLEKAHINACERALKEAILHRRNSLFYRTLAGAHVGDMCMSLIHTAELNHIDPFEHLATL